MSSFKRKTTSKQPTIPLGTRLSPSSLSTIITSTGIPSLDDILGGGLPLSCSSFILAPDSHSAYGELVQKYFIAQGIACGQRVCVIDDLAQEFLDEVMWLPGTLNQTPVKPNAIEEEEDEKASQHDDKIKIAWRYEQMKKFQTTVSPSTSSSEEYCRTFDLTTRIPKPLVEGVVQKGELFFVGVDSTESNSPAATILRRLEEILKDDTTPSPLPIRICIPSLGSPQWGDMKPQEILSFLYFLRRLLRKHPHACASLSLSPHLSSENWGGAGWVQKLGFLSDAAITLAAFTANPSMSAAFPTHHGLVHIHTLPAPHTILPPSDKFSTLRGLSSSGVSLGGSGENNLAFKCMRKRLIFETLHLDLEGGVGERRTTPSTNAVALEAGMTSSTHEHGDDAKSLAAVRIGIEEGAATALTPAPTVGGVDVSAEAPHSAAGGVKAKKPKKRVAFQSDRPDLYDF